MCVLAGILIGLLITCSLVGVGEQEPPRLPQETATVVAAGDIACEPGKAVEVFACRQADTAALVQRINPTAVLTLGDTQYPAGALPAFMDSYDETWGLFKDKTYPAPGNHDYQTSGAAGYFAYFGARAGEPGKGYYSFKVGDWLFVALNSEIDMSVNSPQLAWLRTVLADTKTPCVAAYWHKPRFSSGGHASDTMSDAVWRELYANNVDVVLNGHSHGYERFVPQDPDGNSDTQRGITQIVSGMGGYGPESVASPLPTTAIRQNHTFGVVVLTLMADRAAYRFASIPGAQQFNDSGMIQCH